MEKSDWGKVFGGEEFIPKGKMVNTLEQFPNDLAALDDDAPKKKKKE